MISLRIPALLSLFALISPAAPPAVGEKAPEFSLTSLGGATVQLSDATAKGPVVLVVLRGFPGYQCPLCNRQAREFAARSADFAAAGARVVMVYPGPPEDLKMKAMEFADGKNLPMEFDLLLDPAYTFTEKYDLRWDAPKETAYPSTFLIGKDGKIFFAKVSKTHGGRTTAAEVLDALKMKMKMM